MRIVVFASARISLSEPRAVDRYAEFTAAWRAQKAFRMYLARTRAQRDKRTGQARALYALGRRWGRARRRLLLAKLEHHYRQHAITRTERVNLGRQVFLGRYRATHDRISKLMRDVAKARARFARLLDLRV